VEEFSEIMNRFLSLSLVIALALIPGASANDFGDGSDGALTVTGSESLSPGGGLLATTASIGSTSIEVSPLFAPLAPGMEVLILAAQSPSNSGLYEFNRIVSVSSTIQLESPLSHTYTYEGTPDFRTMVVEVKNFTEVDVTSTGDLGVGFWILAMRATTSINIDGAVQTNGQGFNGGVITMSSFNLRQGESQLGPGGFDYLNNGGGGGAGEDITIPPGGGGGAYATPGANGQQTSSGGFPTDYGRGGAVYGEATLDSEIHLGSGGGVGGAGLIGTSAFGGDGGGLIFLCAPEITLSGAVEANGLDGEDGSGSVISTSGGAGGGAGGTVWLRSESFSGSGAISAVGGSGGAAGSGVTNTGAGGDAGDGRVRIDGPGTGGFTISSGSFHSGPPPVGETTPVGIWSVYR
jgi:hypothetical protein